MNIKCIVEGVSFNKPSTTHCPAGFVAFRNQFLFLTLLEELNLAQFIQVSLYESPPDTSQ